MRFSWLLALRRGVVPGALGAVAASVGIVAGKLAGLAEGQPVNIAPGEAEVLATAAAAVLTASWPVLRNVAKNHPQAPDVLRRIAAVLTCVALVAAAGCVTTRTVAPDGTVTEATTTDQAQVAAYVALVREIWTQYQQFEAQKAAMEPGDQKDKMEQIVQMVQLLRTLTPPPGGVVTLPEGIATR